MEDFNLTNEKKITQKEYNEFMAFKEEYQENEVRRNLLLQQQNDILAGGIRSANLKEYRNTYVFNESDSLDADNPFLMDIEVISEMTKIVSIKLSFKIKNFRAYSTGASSGGGATSGSGGGQTSSAGGAQTSSAGGAQTSSSGGAATPTSSSVSTPSGGGDTSGPTGASLLTGTDRGFTFAAVATLAVQPAYTRSDIGQIFHEDGGGSSTKSVKRHYHSHYVGDHTHTTPDHTHPAHTHTVTIGNHTHTVVDHTHTVVDHTHTVDNHTHTTPNHTHDITYGIHEEVTSPTIQVSISRDNGETYSLPLGSYTSDQGNLDITRFIDTVGEKVIKFTSDVRCRISARVLLKLDIKAR